MYIIYSPNIPARELNIIMIDVILTCYSSLQIQILPKEYVIDPLFGVEGFPKQAGS